MNVKEMHYSFKVKTDKVDSLKNVNFLPAEIDWIINESIQNFVDNKYKDFESIQDLIDQLSSLTIKSPTTIQPAVPVTQVSTGVYQMKLSDLEFKYLHLVRLNALANKTGCTAKIMRGNEVTHDVLDKVLLSPFEGPNYDWVILPYVFGRENTAGSTNSSIYLYTKGEFTLVEAYPEYLKIPTQVFYGGYNSLDGQYTTATPPVDSDLPEAFHRRIINIAVAEVSNYLNRPDYPYKVQKTLTE